jgi:hypothetical protein
MMVMLKQRDDSEGTSPKCSWLHLIIFQLLKKKSMLALDGFTGDIFL